MKQCITCHRNNRRFTDIIFSGETCNYCYAPEKVNMRVNIRPKKLRYCEKGCGRKLKTLEGTCSKCRLEERAAFRLASSYKDKLKAKEYLTKIGKGRLK